MLKLQFLSCLLQRPRSFTQFRTLTSSTSNAANRYEDSLHSETEMLVEENAGSRTVILNRPGVLNALTAPMISGLSELYRSWETDPEVSFIVLKGNGRAFCAGGDIVRIYRLINQGRLEECKEYIRTVYSFMYRLATYSKPQVAILNGITMGAGAGISIHGSRRIATEKTIFAMPEINIGFHPDVGSSYFLSRLPGYLGEYLGLTGDKLNGQEMFASGLATHYSTSANISLIEKHLGDPFSDDFPDLENFLPKYTNPEYPTGKSFLHPCRLQVVNKCFGRDTIEDIMDALEEEWGRSNDEWCASTLKKLREAPPLSLKISLRSIREGRYQNLSQCLVREYRMSAQAVSGQISGDFGEGIRARLVDKRNPPKWDPPCLEQVSQDMMDAYFAPVPANENELTLPSNPREDVFRYQYEKDTMMVKLAVAR